MDSESDAAVWTIGDGAEVVRAVTDGGKGVTVSGIGLVPAVTPMERG
jgi:hypothetical protein